jgi:hypothetical protein
MTVGDVMGPALDKMCRPGGIGRVVEWYTVTLGLLIDFEANVI